MIASQDAACACKPRVCCMPPPARCSVLNCASCVVDPCKPPGRSLLQQLQAINKLRPRRQYAADGSRPHLLPGLGAAQRSALAAPATAFAHGLCDPGPAGTVWRCWRTASVLLLSSCRSSAGRPAARPDYKRGPHPDRSAQQQREHTHASAQSISSSKDTPGFFSGHTQAGDHRETTGRWRQ